MNFPPQCNSANPWVLRTMHHFHFQTHPWIWSPVYCTSQTHRCPALDETERLLLLLKKMWIIHEFNSVPWPHPLLPSRVYRGSVQKEVLRLEYVLSLLPIPTVSASSCCPAHEAISSFLQLYLHLGLQCHCVAFSQAMTWPLGRHVTWWSSWVSDMLRSHESCHSSPV